MFPSIRWTRLAICLLLAWNCLEADGQSAEPPQLPQGPGLAANYPGDELIESDQRVLFVDDFETGDISQIANRWGNGLIDGGRVQLDSEIHTQSPGRQSVRIRFGHLYTHIRPQDKVFVRYYQRFHPECGYTHHLPFLLADRVPTPWPKGFAGARADGHQFFGSSLDAWGDWGKTPPPGRRMLYTYWQEMQRSRDGMFWGNSFEALQFPPIERGKWNCVEVMMEANSAPEKPDGRQAFWIDGQLVGDFSGIRWRATDRLKLNSFWLLHDGETGSTLNGDKEHAQRSYDLWFDDLVIATEYIGPIQGLPKSGKKVANPSQSALLTGELTAMSSHRVYQENYAAGVGKFDQGEPVDAGLSFGPDGTGIFHVYQQLISESAFIRFRIKPLTDIQNVEVLIWSPELNDNLRYPIHDLITGKWTTIEMCPIDMRSGHSNREANGLTVDNFKIVFKGSEKNRALLDDFEVYD